jgi:hypothetical protein
LKRFIDQRNEKYRNSEDLSHSGPLAFIKAEFAYLLKPYAIWDGVLELSSKPLKIETIDKVTRELLKKSICYIFVTRVYFNQFKVGCLKKKGYH